MKRSITDVSSISKRRKPASGTNGPMICLQLKQVVCMPSRITRLRTISNPFPILFGDKPELDSSFMIPKVMYLDDPSWNSWRNSLKLRYLSPEFPEVMNKDSLKCFIDWGEISAALESLLLDAFPLLSSAALEIVWFLSPLCVITDTESRRALCDETITFFFDGGNFETVLFE